MPSSYFQKLLPSFPYQNQIRYHALVNFSTFFSKLAPLDFVIMGQFFGPFYLCRKPVTHTPPKNPPLVPRRLLFHSNYQHTSPCYSRRICCSHQIFSLFDFLDCHVLSSLSTWFNSPLVLCWDAPSLSIHFLPPEQPPPLVHWPSDSLYMFAHRAVLGGFFFSESQFFVS